MIDNAERLRALARRAQIVRARNVAERALLSHLIGALWALSEAERLRGPAAQSKRRPGDVESLASVAGAVSKGKAPQDRRWVIGFHFNSALYRLASLAERLGKYRRHDRRPIQDVSKEVQRLKHDIEGLSRIRSVDMTRAIGASSRLVGMIEGAFSQALVDEDA